MFLSDACAAPSVRRCSVRTARDAAVGFAATMAASRRRPAPSPGFNPAILSARPRDPVERAAEIGNVDQREQQAGHPEDMHVREQGKQAQHGDDLELQLVALVRHALGKGVQAQETDTDRQNGDDQEDGHRPPSERRFHPAPSGTPADGGVLRGEPTSSSRASELSRQDAAQPIAPRPDRAPPASGLRGAMTRSREAAKRLVRRMCRSCRPGKRRWQEALI